MIQNTHHFKCRNRSEVKVKVAQSCPALCDPIDYTVHGILQARILEWVAYLFSSGLPHPGIKPEAKCRKAIGTLSQVRISLRE